MLSFHVTDLDALAYYEASETMELPELLSRLRRESEPPVAAKIGTAWHKVLEHADSALSEIEQDGFQFRVEAHADIVLPQIRELRCCRSLDIGGVPVMMIGTTDGISGNVVTDHKLTFRPDPLRYENAMQWRCYLWLFEATRFDYLIYGAKMGNDNSVIIRSVDSVSFYRYPAMESDIFCAVAHFVEFARSHLPERFD